MAPIEDIHDDFVVPDGTTNDSTSSSDDSDSGSTSSSDSDSSINDNDRDEHDYLVISRHGKIPVILRNR